VLYNDGMRDSCLFCKIARGQIPSHRVHDDEVTIAFMEVGPVNPGHVIVAIKPHLETIGDLSPDLAAAAFKTVTRIARALEAVFKPEGLTILQTNGLAGGQPVPHFHLHVLPRRSNDGVMLTWPRQNPPADELARLAGQIRQQEEASRT
jgi:histidine triad (HIT) family protein